MKEHPFSIGESKTKQTKLLDFLKSATLNQRKTNDPPSLLLVVVCGALLTYPFPYHVGHALILLALPAPLYVACPGVVESCRH